MAPPRRSRCRSACLPSGPWRIFEPPSGRMNASIRTAYRADRRLRGEVTLDAITLWVQDAHLTARRKSWNIEFRGELEGSDRDAILNGTIEIRDEARMRWLMRLIRIASTLPVVFAILLVVRDGITGPNVAGIVLAAAIGAMAFVGTEVMETAGEKAAADDATAPIRFIRSQLASGTDDRG